MVKDRENSPNRLLPAEDDAAPSFKRDGKDILKYQSGKQNVLRKRS